MRRKSYRCRGELELKGNRKCHLIAAAVLFDIPFVMIAPDVIEGAMADKMRHIRDPPVKSSINSSVGQTFFQLSQVMINSRKMQIQNFCSKFNKKYNKN